MVIQTTARRFGVALRAALIGAALLVVMQVYVNPCRGIEPGSWRWYASGCWALAATISAHTPMVVRF
ncbi:MAG: hypothetical protein M3Q55_02660 [Acidobacteriota bacterium]|nr:hypothetical protein [Acidobacteriota bacterium]